MTAMLNTYVSLNISPEKVSQTVQTFGEHVSILTETEHMRFMLLITAEQAESFGTSVLKSAAQAREFERTGDYTQPEKDQG